VHAEPHVAFGRSSDFTPGGREFDTIMDGLTADDLYVPWLIADDAKQLGYSVGAKWNVTGDDHRNQTRYFFSYVFFRVASQVLRGTTKVDLSTRHQLYAQLIRLRKHVKASGAGDAPFSRLLGLADKTVATYMALAQASNWYSDRNAFLKRDDLLNEEHLLSASGDVLIERPGLKAQTQTVLDAEVK
jgi:hypothetical protein